MIVINNFSKTEKAEKVKIIIKDSQILGYKVLGFGIILEIIYKFVTGRDIIDLTAIFFISISISLMYQCKKEVFEKKWNKIIFIFCIVLLLIFTISLIVFFYINK